MVIGTQLTYPEIKYVNSEICRKADKCFYAAGISGFYGYAAIDLGPKYTYTVERQRSNVAVSIGKETYTRSVLSITPNTKKEGKAVFDTILRSESYIPISSVVESSTSLRQGFDKIRKPGRVSPLLLLFLAQWYLQKDIQQQELSSSSEDLSSSSSTLLSDLLTPSKIKETALLLCNRLNLPIDLILPPNDLSSTDSLIESFISTNSAEISPIAAILGGLVAQQVLNTISKKQHPLQNFLILNGDLTAGPVYCVV